MRGQPITYSAAEMAWLEANRTMVLGDYHRAFVEAFGRSDISIDNLNGLRKRKGWKVGREPGRLSGRYRLFNAEEMTWLKANATLVISEYHRAFCEAFQRQDVSLASICGLRKRMGWKTGRTGQFAPGAVSHNKGKKCPPGVGGRHPNAMRTQFTSATSSLKANAKYQPIGTERVSKDGYLERKVHDGLPLQSRWRAVHLIRWEEINGPVPGGHCLKALDGDKTNTDPANWCLISRGVLPRLNGGRATRTMAYDSAPSELKPTLLAMAKVEDAASKARRRRAA